MKPYRKPFAGDPLYPLQIVHMATKYPQNELPDHLHDHCEIVYVYGGHGTFFIDDTFYDKSPGDLFLIPGNTIHRAFPDADNPIRSSALFFAPAFPGAADPGDDYSPLGCFERARRDKRYKLEAPAGLKADVERQLELIAEELQKRQPGYREAAKLALGQLLLRLNRFVMTERQGTADAGLRVGPPWIRDVLRMIDEHPESGEGLSALAGRAGVSAAHFSRVFKQLTGMNVTDYVNAKRIVRAKEMLRRTDDSVGAIAERCGFDSLPHFHRVFKSLTGQTPGAYRRDGSGLP